MKAAPQTVELGTYQHTKTGRLYEVIGIALQIETEEDLVIYRPLYESTYKLFARPRIMFTEIVTVNGKQVARFEKHKEEGI